MELLEQLELVEVVYEEKYVLLQFVDHERGELREVKWNKQAYDQDAKKYYDSEEKAQQCEEWAKEFFGLTFDTLAQAIGEKRDVYAYDTYNSLFESKQLKKFDLDMVGQIMEVTISEVVDTGKAIVIKFPYDDEIYFSQMSYTKKIESLNQFIVDPIKKQKQYARFNDKFGFPVSEKEKLVGQNVMIEIKKAFNNDKQIYAEIKPFPKKKK